MKVLPYFVSELNGHLIEEIHLIKKSIEENKRLNDDGDFSAVYYHELKSIIPMIEESIGLMNKLENYPMIGVTLSLERAQELNNFVYDLTETNKQLIHEHDISIAKRTLLLMELDSISKELLDFLVVHVPTS